MTRLSVHHTTRYRYRKSVGFGEHRLMFRPRDSHDLRLVEATLQIAPAAQVRWLHDAFSNSIAIATFSEPADSLNFDSRIVIEHFGLNDPEFPVSPEARSYPFEYDPVESVDLESCRTRSDADPHHRVGAWARDLLAGRDRIDTQELLVGMTHAIHRDFAYERRYKVGVQAPAETLERGQGSCRDLALLMMAASRALGLAARFVSGYLYDPAASQPGGSSLQGAGETHAWVQVYLPGAGWVEFDPTNGLVGGANLIRVAVAREPAQALPLQGSYFGAPEDFIDMQVEVRVSADATYSKG